MAESRNQQLGPGFWLYRTALEWRDALEHNLRPLGLTVTQFSLLACTDWLARRGEPPTQQEVADMAGADRTTASKAIKVLERRKLLTRKPNPNDARAMRPELTAEGRALVGRAADVKAATDRQVFGSGADRPRWHPSATVGIDRVRSAWTAKSTNRVAPLT